jgi:hypothetical protein
VPKLSSIRARVTAWRPRSPSKNTACRWRSVGCRSSREVIFITPPASKLTPRVPRRRASAGSMMPWAKRQIGAVGAVRLELRGKAVMGAVGFRRHQKAGRILVDAVDDAGPHLAADARQAARAMVQQRVDQRAVAAAGRGVDDHPGGLVDDDQVVVFRPPYVS